MKRIVFLLCVLFVGFSTYAQLPQIPNNDFENWADTSHATSWTSEFSGTYSTNYFGMDIALDFTFNGARQSDNAHSGTYAMKLQGQVVELNYLGLIPIGSYVFPGICQLGTFEIAGDDFSFVGGVPCTEVSTGMTAWVKYELGAGSSDNMLAGIVFTKWNSQTQTRDTVAGGSATATQSDADYRELYIPVTRLLQVQPDTMNIVFATAQGINCDSNTVLYVDGVSLDQTTIPIDSSLLTTDLSLGIYANNAPISSLTVNDIAENVEVEVRCSNIGQTIIRANESIVITNSITGETTTLTTTAPFNPNDYLAFTDILTPDEMNDLVFPLCYTLTYAEDDVTTNNQSCVAVTRIDSSSLTADIAVSVYANNAPVSNLTIAETDNVEVEIRCTNVGERYIHANESMTITNSATGETTTLTTTSTLLPNSYLSFNDVVTPAELNSIHLSLCYTLVYAEDDVSGNNQSCVTIDRDLGVNEITDADITVYPNPAKQYITITNALNKQISIYDLTGQAIEMFNSNVEQYDMNLSNYASGIYLIKIADDRQIITKKISILR